MQPEEHYVPVEDGFRLHAWVFRPEGVDGPVPAITMAHGFSGLKYRGLQRYAERFARAGFAVIVHDHRNFGLSGGDVRGDIDPWKQIADWRRVISYLENLPGVDAGCIGVWGTSYAGGHAMVLGATDSRIRAVVAQVPIISGYEQGLRRVPPDARATQQELFSEDERAQLRGEPPMTQLVVSLDPSVRAAYRSKDMMAFHDAFEIPEGVEHGDHVTLRSSRLAQMYEPGQWVSRIGPKPLLMVVAENDVITPADLALAAYERALEPKKLRIIRRGHFDAYLSEFEDSSSAARDWFVQHLLTRTAP
ncbi:alpha/beta hydrolase [Variovorax ginsengisoli]|uniref:Alpha/beta hydrolase n=1 Tax=Variovorax ginsengisoli TaxID=363844 RepID=A0ABT8SGI9_9BURK|nr:alpha/beta hydrolase [Variovorax ginsengisoli]MDN8617431.1 alpha/beta hydrolase [Variovorax ginsengisoli]MDO1536601.1 alpha/beta hydrolase [Variovorax ginsengisoli]